MNSAVLELVEKQVNRKQMACGQLKKEVISQE